MIDEAVSKIRTLLESGEILDIGGRPQTKTEGRTPPPPNQTVPATTSRSTTALVAAFAAVYLIWGSTYLAIRYAVETFPPLLMMGVRHMSAGASLYGWARGRGT